ncbi:MAG: TA system VapC family ribonuclease toxin [Planctomycetota bacterium]
MIAVDTNLLVYAHRLDSAWQQRACAVVTELAEGRSPWALPWPCLHEFLAIVTHPRIYSPPSRLADAMRQVDSWLTSPAVVLLAEGDEHWRTLREQLERAQITGPQVHDARVATLCLQHGVREIWTADRDFARFGALRSRNPLVD